MTPERFTDWLQGFVEIQQSESITDTQWLIIKDHLKLVFDKKTPDRSSERDSLDKQKLTDLMRPKPIDLIGNQFDSTFWINNPPVITC